jgi:hypothetical protein
LHNRISTIVDIRDAEYPRGWNSSFDLNLLTVAVAIYETGSVTGSA